MKHLKFLAVSLLLFVGVHSMSAQQGKGLQMKQQNMEKSQKHRQDTHHKKMQQQLSLTDDQIKNIEVIRSKRADKIQKLREQIWSLKDEERKEIQATLTPEQKEKFEQYRGEYGEQNRGRNFDMQDKNQLQKKKMHKNRKHR